MSDELIGAGGPRIELLEGDRPARITSEYVTGMNKAGDWFIIHRACGLRSYNPNDVANRYCGKCKVFIEDHMLPGNGHMDRQA